MITITETTDQLPPKQAITITEIRTSAYAGRLAYHNHFQHAALGGQPLVPHAPELVVGRSVTDGRREPLVLTEVGLPTLLLVVSAECPYCAENMPRWARLLETLDREPSANLDVIALSTSGSEQTAAYLAEHGIAPARVLLIDRRELAGLGLRGVPGTVAVTPGSPTLRSWAGVLSDKRNLSTTLRQMGDVNYGACGRSDLLSWAG